MRHMTQALLSMLAHHWAAVISFLGGLPVVFGSINTAYEQWNRFEVQAPSGVAINSGDLLLFGRGTKIMVGTAQESQAASGSPVYDDNSGFITMQVTGAMNLSVSGFVSKSPSAGGAIKRGDPVYADGGTFDPVTGITYANSIDADANGTFIGLAMDPVAAGATTTIRVILKNSCGG